MVDGCKLLRIRQWRNVVVRIVLTKWLGLLLCLLNAFLEPDSVLRVAHWCAVWPVLFAHICLESKH